MMVRVDSLFLDFLLLSSVEWILFSFKEDKTGVANLFGSFD